MNEEKGKVDALPEHLANRIRLIQTFLNIQADFNKPVIIEILVTENHIVALGARRHDALSGALEEIEAEDSGRKVKPTDLKLPSYVG